MIGVTGMAACAIAGRNAVFKIVPRVYVNRIYERGEEGRGRRPEDARAAAADVIEKYAKRGVTPAQIFAKLGVKGLEDITLEHIELLSGSRPRSTRADDDRQGIPARRSRLPRHPARPRRRRAPSSS
jgi:hypothetical protein